MDKPNSDQSAPSRERRTKPISKKEKELTEALDFLVDNLKMHSEEYHHKTDARKVKRCESILEEAISELIARKERESVTGSATRWRKRRGKRKMPQSELRLIKWCKEFVPIDEINSLRRDLRGI